MKIRGWYYKGEWAYTAEYSIYVDSAKGNIIQIILVPILKLGGGIEQSCCIDTIPLGMKNILNKPSYKISSKTPQHPS